jgi:hypothetical protein
MKTLHIINGEATLYVFKQTQIVGDVLIWNEILSEGPVSKTNLWELRADWMLKSFNEPKANYSQKVVKEAEKLENLEEYNEVILWFEFDLVCQINLTYILSVLYKNYQSALPIYLICADKIEGVPNFRGLGQLNADQLLKLYPTKVRLQKTDLAFAADVWNIYVSNDYEQIKEFLNSDFGNLPLLRKAIGAHLSRFAKESNGLNYIEETLLSLIATGIRTRDQLYELFWKQEPIFGITDLQLGLILNKLKERGLTTI